MLVHPFADPKSRPFEVRNGWYASPGQTRFIRGQKPQAFWFLMDISFVNGAGRRPLAPLQVGDLAAPLMKIDHYGEVLIGCVHCNYWGRPGDKRPIMEMLEDDLEALRASVRRKRH